VYISNVDRIASQKLSKKLKRNAAQEKREVRYDKFSEINVVPDCTGSESEVHLASVHRASESESDDNLPLAAVKRKIRIIKKRNRKKFPTLARACDRQGVSDRDAAAIASAVLQDYGIVSKEDCFNVIDRNKVRRYPQVCILMDERIRLS